MMRDLDSARTQSTSGCVRFVILRQLRHWSQESNANPLLPRVGGISQFNVFARVQATASSWARSWPSKRYAWPSRPRAILFCSSLMLSCWSGNAENAISLKLRLLLFFGRHLFYQQGDAADLPAVHGNVHG